MRYFMPVMFGLWIFISVLVWLYLRHQDKVALTATQEKVMLRDKVTDQDRAEDLCAEINLTLGWRAADPRFPYDGSVILREAGVRAIVALSQRVEALQSSIRHLNGVATLDRDVAELQRGDRLRTRQPAPAAYNESGDVTAYVA